MKVTPDSTDVTTYFVLRLAADGTEATALTITNFDLQYVRSGAAPAAKVDATALGATNSAHADNQAIEIDPTDQPGLYRVDWPDAAFAAGVREVILTVKCATAFTEHLRVELEHKQTADHTAGIADLPTNAELATALGTADDAVLTAIADLPTNAELATALGTADDAVLTAIGDLPTNAELATALGTADDAVLAAIAALVNFNPATSEIETGITWVEGARLWNAATGGKASGLDTTNAKYRDLGDTKDRIDATVDADGNRTAVTLDLS